jgi:2,4-dichlorophenol 6-monooxygenase
VPSGRPGSHLPHAWIERDGARVSTLDLVPYDRFTLIAGPDGAAWATAAAAQHGVRAVVAGRDFGDPEGRWAALAGIGRDGAVLVRPDQHVAWRATTLCSTARDDLAGTFATILQHG